MTLADPIEKLPYIGRVYARRLRRLQIKTVRDLLYHFPFRYRDFSTPRRIRDLREEENVSIRGRIVRVTDVRSKRGKLLTKAAIADESGAIEALWFNQPYLSRTFKEGVEISLAGKVENFGGKLTLVSPEFELVKGDRIQIHTQGLVPIYPETEQVTSKWLRSRIRSLLASPVEVPEFLPKDLLQQENLPERRAALRMFHFPTSLQEAEKARRRFSFEELFLFNLRALRQRYYWESHRSARRIEAQKHRSELERFIRSFPFRLTNAQQRATREILADLAKDRPMNRLLEGDVGSGKTAVAAVAVYLTFLSGAKTVFMAPTEILVDQHFQTLKEFLEPFGVKIALHTGATKPAEGEDFDLWIGTHALFYRRGNFENVGLVVIDEQHRFGVEQRAKLLEVAKGKTVPHLLTLTATPIPRTLALTVYGDLDLSILNESPPGRKPPKTFVVPARKRAAGYQWVYRRVQAGEQAFIVCPLIEESSVETLQQVKSAVAEYEKIRKQMPGVTVGLLHGRLPAREKSKIMERFQSGEIAVLVSTPVVEVGIDVPNATIMIIEAAERFGLASLHQLRGRIGRGTKESFCFLFTSESSESLTPPALEGSPSWRRLKYLERVKNGFDLAEIDLKLRGPGEIYGVKQHGLTELKIADLTDAALLKVSRDAAQKIITPDPTLASHPSLKEELDRFSATLVEPN